MNELVRFAMVAFFPRDGELPGLSELGVEEKIARLRRETTPLFWAGIVLAAVFFQLTPILTVRRPWPASFLTDEELDAHASRIASHPTYLVRQIVMLLKLMAGVFWGESPEIRAAIALPAYGVDPGTRRVGPLPPPPPRLPRAPVPALVTLGRLEEARGRVHAIPARRAPDAAG